jgi:uncharacterized membrane protein YkoI
MHSFAVHIEMLKCCSRYKAGFKIKINRIMKNKNIIAGLLAAAIVAVGAAGCTTEKQEQAELQAQAKISKDQAQQTALAKAPGGTVKEGELEKEKGKLIWSFDISTPDSKEITEVNVDAITDEVVSVEKEEADKD